MHLPLPQTQAALRRQRHIQRRDAREVPAIAAGCVIAKRQLLVGDARIMSWPNYSTIAEECDGDHRSSREGRCKVPRRQRWILIDERAEERLLAAQLPIRSRPSLRRVDGELAAIGRKP